MIVYILKGGKTMDKSINAMAAFTDILKMQDVESSMDEIKMLWRYGKIRIAKHYL